MTPTQLTLNLVEGSVSFSFSPTAARELQAAIAQLMDRLKAVAVKSTPIGKATPQPPMEYRHVGEVFLEVFCNPNIWASPFAAKVLLTIKDSNIRITSEAELTRISEDLERYLAETEG